MNWRKEQLKNLVDQPIGGPREETGNSEPKAQGGAVACKQGKPPSLIPKEYKDLRNVFSENGSDELPPHLPTDCSIEILQGLN